MEPLLHVLLTWKALDPSDYTTVARRLHYTPFQATTTTYHQRFSESQGTDV